MDKLESATAFDPWVSHPFSHIDIDRSLKNNILQTLVLTSCLAKCYVNSGKNRFTLGWRILKQTQVLVRLARRPGVNCGRREQ